MKATVREKFKGLQWTSQQLDAIRHEGSSVLVSAAAGAGKTEVLARHCAYLLANSVPPCEVSELLVVTFTDAAAAEMRERIGRIVRQMSGEDPDDNHLARQAVKVSTAAISTIHSFCQQVLRQHFAAAGLDPQFRIIDADEALLLKTDVLKEVFEEFYTDRSDAGKTFRDMVELYGSGSDNGLQQMVLRLSDFLSSLVCPEHWRQEALVWLEPVDGKPNQDMLGAYGGLLSERFQQRVSLCRHNTQRIRAVLDRPEIKNLGPEGYARMAGFTQSLEKLADGWQKLINTVHKGRLDELAYGIRGLMLDLPSSPRTKDENTKAAIQEIKDLFRAAAPTASQEKLLELVGTSLAEHAAGMEKCRPYGRMMVELAERLEEKYQQAKDREHRLDFADLERRCFNLLNAGEGTELAPSAVAGELQQRFRYVLADEFQDINPLQDAILRLASRELDSRQVGNLFAVGDIKQSVYRFRLAEPGIFQERMRLRGEPAGGRVIDLQSNFRSRTGIITAVNLLFERLMSRTLGGAEYDERAALRFAQSQYEQAEQKEGATFNGPAVEVHLLAQADRTSGGEAEDDEQGGQAEESEVSLDQVEKEAVLVGKRIRYLLGQDEANKPMQVLDKDPATGQMRYRRIAYRDIAVLLRVTKHQAEPMARVLRQMDIPVYCDAETGYFATTEIQDLLALLEILDNPRQDIPLAAVLRSPLGGFTDTDLARIRLRNREAVFHEAALELAGSEAKAADDKLMGRLEEFYQRLGAWRKLVRDLPLGEALWEIYQETGYLHYVSGLPGGQGRQGNLLKLYERARQFGSFARTGLRRFIQFMADLQERQADLGMAPGISEVQDVVRIMSVHKSKGLEFPVVIVPRLSHQFNFTDARGNIIIDRQRYLGLCWVDREKRLSYPTLAQRLVRDNIERHTRAEEMRLLYVGLTRAREHLILVGSGKARELEPFGLEAEAGSWGGGEKPKDFELASKRRWLDWLIPALGSLGLDALQLAGDRTHPEIARGKATFVVSVHGPEEFSENIFAETKGKHHLRAGLTLEQIATLEAVDGLPQPSGELAELLALIDQPYQYEHLTPVPAVVSGTERKRVFEPGMDEELDAAGPFRSEQAQELAELREALREKQERLSAAQIGSLNHLFLQNIDLTRSCNQDDLRKQAAELVRRGLVDKASLEVLDIAGAASFFATELGKAMRDSPGAVYREIPFVLAIGPGELAAGVQAEGPEDRPIVRGIIDLLMVQDGQATIVDFKTDRVSAGELAQRVDTYRWQMEMYGRAVRDILGLPKVRKMLYFLSPRQLVQMD